MLKGRYFFSFAVFLVVGAILVARSGISAGPLSPVQCSVRLPKTSKFLGRAPMISNKFPFSYVDVGGKKGTFSGVYISSAESSSHLLNHVSIYFTDGERFDVVVGCTIVGSSSVYIPFPHVSAIQEISVDAKPIRANESPGVNFEGNVAASHLPPVKDFDLIPLGVARGLDSKYARYDFTVFDRDACFAGFQLRVPKMGHNSVGSGLIWRNSPVVLKNGQIQIRMRDGSVIPLQLSDTPSTHELTPGKMETLTGSRPLCGVLEVTADVSLLKKNTKSEVQLVGFSTPQR